ncbi:hypothetical protein C8R46DRAFT_1088007 [Mycena filopes]|nr:hypothetical protein C8R46DRAFT_1088007 [Mycena filopes]
MRQHWPQAQVQGLPPVFPLSQSASGFAIHNPTPTTYCLTPIWHIPQTLSRVDRAAAITAMSICSSLLLWASSLLPLNVSHYIGIATIATVLVAYAVNRGRPTTRLRRLQEKVNTIAEVLTRAKSDFPQYHFVLTEEENDLLHCQLSASRIQTRLLKAGDAPWKIYFQTMWQIRQSLSKCGHRVKDVHRAAMLTIETANQRKLTDSIAQNQETLHAARSLDPSRWFNRFEASVSGSNEGLNSV